MTAAGRRGELEDAIRAALTTAWRQAVAYTPARLGSQGVPLGYPDAAAVTGELLGRVDACVQAAVDEAVGRWRLTIATRERITGGTT